MKTLTPHYAYLKFFKSICLVLLAAIGIYLLLTVFEPISYFTNYTIVNGGVWQRKTEGPKVQTPMPLVNMETGNTKIPVEKTDSVSSFSEEQGQSMEPEVEKRTGTLNIDADNTEKKPVNNTDSVAHEETKMSVPAVKNTAGKPAGARFLSTINAGADFLKQNSLRNNDIIKELSLVTKMYEFHFKTGQVQLDQNVVKDQLDSTIQKCVEAPEGWSKIIILGFTDNRGSKLTNVKIGMKRAEQIRIFLVNCGIPSEKITIASFGPELPIGSNNDEEGRERNRRVEINLLGNGG